MSDLENAVIDVANMQADELFAERVHKVLCEALGYGTDGVPITKQVTKFSIVLEMAIRNILTFELSRQAQSNSGLLGNAQQPYSQSQYSQSQYSASSTANPFQQGYPQYQGTPVLGGLFK
jgi:hypothetical protein